MPVSQTIQEYASSAGQSLRVERERGVIHGVKVIGLESRNGRTYKPDCLAKAMPLYEGAAVFVDHGGEGKQRSYRDRIGRLTGINAKTDGLYADLTFNKKHPLADQLAEDAEFSPGNLGLSHVVEATTSRKDGKLIVEEIVKVNSVDIVAVPATTASLFESEGMPHDDVVLAEHGLCATSDARTILLGSDPIETKKSRLLEVLAAWQAELSGVQKENLMEMKDITVEMLKQQRPDLVAVLVPDAKLQEQVKSLTEAVAAKEAELKVASDKLSVIEAEKSAQAKTLAIAEELKAAKLDASDKLAVSEAFMSMLNVAPDAAARKLLIEDRVAIFSKSHRSSGSGSPPFGTVGGSPVPASDGKAVETVKELLSVL